MKETEAGDLEISSEAKNYDINICIYIKSYYNVTKEFYYNKLNYYGNGELITIRNLNNVLFIEYSNNNHYDILLYKQKNIREIKDFTFNNIKNMLEYNNKIKFMGKIKNGRFLRNKSLFNNNKNLKYNNVDISKISFSSSKNIINNNIKYINIKIIQITKKFTFFKIFTK